MGLIDKLFNTGTVYSNNGDIIGNLENNGSKTKIYKGSDYQGYYSEERGKIVKYDKCGDFIGEGIVQNDGSLKFYDRYGNLEYTVASEGINNVYRKVDGTRIADMDNTDYLSKSYQEALVQQQYDWWDDDDDDDDEYYQKEAERLRNFRYPDSDYR